jgi:hypothetical protein
VHAVKSTGGTNKNAEKDIVFFTDGRKHLGHPLRMFRIPCIHESWVHVEGKEASATPPSQRMLSVSRRRWHVSAAVSPFSYKTPSHHQTPLSNALQLSIRSYHSLLLLACF